MTAPVQKSYSDLVRHFTGVVASSSHGKLLLTIWFSYLGLLVSLPKRKKPKAAKPQEAKTEDEPPQRKKPKVSNDALLRLIAILRQGASPLDTATFVAYVLSLTSRIFVTVKLADLSGNLASFMGARKYSEMFSGQAWFGLFCIVASACTAAMKFLEAQCESCARDILFRYLKERYLDPETLRYYRQELPDAPARLSSDLKEFSSTLVHSIGHFLKPLIDVVYLSAVMSKRIGFRQLMIFYTFFWFSDWSINRFRTRALPKSLKQSTVERQELESGMRDNLTRVHHYREQIAMQKGTLEENKTITKQFKEYQKITQFELYMSFVLDCVKSYTIKYGGLMCAFSIITPSSYLDPSKTPEEITAGFMANASLLGSLASAVKDMADSMNELPKIRGYAERVYGLDESMRKCEERICKNDLLQVKGDKFEIEGVSILAPSQAGQGSTLIENLNFDLKEGDDTVIRGPNGIGKSSIFRTLTGLWKAEKEAATAKLQVPESCFVVPQDTYFPNNKSLRAQMTYPKEESLLSEKEALVLLKDVGLSVLTDRYTVDDVMDWANVLSGGQKQRLSWARLFFHCPKYALLDEATSAISTDMVDNLFNQAKKRNITLLTISHSAQVDAHHKRAIDIKGEGRYETKNLE